VIVIDRRADSAVSTEAVSYEGLAERVHAFEKSGLDRRSALKKAAKEFGLSKSEAYRMMEEHK